MTLTDTSGSLQVLSPLTWSAGVGTATVSVGTAISRDRVIATDAYFGSTPAPGSSSVFAVHGGLSYFHVDGPAASTQTGSQITLTITALDAGAQPVTNYVGPVTLTDVTGTLTQVFPAWSNGVGIATVAIGTAVAHDRITVSTAGYPLVAGETGQSGVFSVLGSLDHFHVDLSATSVAVGAPLTVTVTALDAGSQTVTSYAGPVTFTDVNLTGRADGSSDHRVDERRRCRNRHDRGTDRTGSPDGAGHVGPLGAQRVLRRHLDPEASGRKPGNFCIPSGSCAHDSQSLSCSRRLPSQPLLKPPEPPRQRKPGRSRPVSSPTYDECPSSGILKTIVRRRLRNQGHVQPGPGRGSRRRSRSRSARTMSASTSFPALGCRHGEDHRHACIDPAEDPRDLGEGQPEL